MRRCIGVYSPGILPRRQRGRSNFAGEIKEIFCNEPRNGGTSFTTGWLAVRELRRWRTTPPSWRAYFLVHARKLTPRRCWVTLPCGFYLSAVITH